MNTGYMETAYIRMDGKQTEQNHVEEDFQKALRNLDTYSKRFMRDQYHAIRV